jgi:Alginate lyase
MNKNYLSFFPSTGKMVAFALAFAVFSCSNQNLDLETTPTTSKSAARIAATPPNVSLIDPTILANRKTAYESGNVEVVRQVQIVLRKADEFLIVTPQSVMDKNFTPSSNSKHDYMSMGPYWWPDPTKPDGLPYIKKDGQRNPEIAKITDRQYLENLDTRCKFLSLAFYFTKNQKYATKAHELLKVWFLNSATKMNPNLKYAQAIPGITEGRGIGIIESRFFESIADWINLLDGSTAFLATDKNLIIDWYKQYLNWMLTSSNGIEESKEKNNHGTHYDAQVTAYALFTNNSTTAVERLNKSKSRVSVQIQSSGKQPLELSRTLAYTYSTFNLEAWFNLSMMGDKAGVNLWNYTASNGGNIIKALNWLIPYALEEKPRTYQQIEPYNSLDLYPLLLIASRKYNTDYSQKLALIPKNDDTAILDLLYK